MKAFVHLLVPFYILVFMPLRNAAQVFNAPILSTTSVDIDNSLDYTDCGNPGTAIAEINVTSTTTLSSSFELASIDLSFNLACGGNMRDLGIWIKSPAGTCMKVYNPSAQTFWAYSSLTGIYNMSLRDGNCLLLPDVRYADWAINTNKAGDGYYGAFKASATQTLSQAFSGQNPFGIWRIYAAETNATYDWAPCLSAASLKFTNATLTDQTSAGGSCANPIVWSGQPICASNSGKDSSTVSPGYDVNKGRTGGYVTKIGGADCAWNASNDNNVWVQFKPLGAGNVCISISGLSAVTQSLIVTDANIDGDNNPCTQGNGSLKTATNDPYWTAVNCPESAGIYSANSNTGGGINYSQQHCFIAEANKTYYLVIDGLAGSTTPFYITGISGPLPAILALEEATTKATVLNSKTEHVMMNGSILQTNIGNQKINQEIRIYDAFGRIIYNENRMVSGFTDFNLNTYMQPGFNLVSIRMDDSAPKTYTFRINKIR